MMKWIILFVFLFMSIAYAQPVDTTVSGGTSFDSSNYYNKISSDLKYASKDSIQTWAETEALIFPLIYDSVIVWASRLIEAYGIDNSNYYLLFPDTAYIANGYDNRIYFDNLGIGMPETPSVLFVPDSGDATASYWHWTPTTASEFNYNLAIQNQTTLRTAMIVRGGDIISSTKTLLAIGDSRTVGGEWVTELRDTVGSNLTLIGTVGTPPYLYEASGGKTYTWYASNVASPFSPNGYMDFQGYLDDNGFNAPDFVIIRLGTNDIFSCIDNNINTTATAALRYADSLIAGIHDANINTMIGLCLETPPANDSIFLATYGITQTYTQYKKNIHRFNELLVGKYGANGTNTTKNVSLIPLYLGSDKDNDFVNGVHENAQGYSRNFVSILAWLWGHRVYAYGSEIMVNGTFNSNITNWTANGTPATLEWSAGKAHIISDASGLNDGMYQLITVEAGKRYEFSFDIEIITNPGAIRGSVFLATSGIYTDAYINYINPSGSYTYTADFIAPANETAYVWFFQTNATASEFYIDNVSIREKN